MKTSTLRERAAGLSTTIVEQILDGLKNESHELRFLALDYVSRDLSYLAERIAIQIESDEVVDT